MTIAQRVKKSRADRTSKGGHRIDVMLNPKAATKLAKYRAKGAKTSEVVNELIERSQP